ncbi:MAG TPA: hypothetical protein VLA77_02125 [Candidatus Saccharimonadales bacterium]|nr:hypothetical protein [Candidatus Saccharimonadales bacterium]
MKNVFWREGDRIAIGDRLSVMKWVFNHRFAHLMTWGVLVFGLITNGLIKRANAGDAYSLLEYLAVLVVAIFTVMFMGFGMTVVAEDVISRNRVAGITIIRRDLHKLWLQMMRARATEVGPIDVLTAERILAQNAGFWWSVNTAESTSEDRNNALQNLLSYAFPAKNV